MFGQQKLLLQLCAWLSLCLHTGSAASYKNFAKRRARPRSNGFKVVTGKSVDLSDVYEHEGWRTCTIDSPDLRSMGKFCVVLPFLMILFVLLT
mgnify:CR=1 FL=1